MTWSLKNVTGSDIIANRAQPLRLFALSPPEVCPSKYLVTFPTRKVLALLIYLAINVVQPCEHLSALLRPETSTEYSHNSLRNILGQISQLLRSLFAECYYR